MADVRLVVEPGRKTRDKVNQKDVGPGEEFSLPESDANIEIALGNARRASDQAGGGRSFPAAPAAGPKPESAPPPPKPEPVPKPAPEPAAVAPMTTESSAPLVGDEVQHDARLFRRNRHNVTG